MNDDLESAEAHLNKGNSPFHQVRILCAPLNALHMNTSSSDTVRSRSMHVHEGNFRLRTGDYARRSGSTLQSSNIRTRN
jgi:hypothetical protein